MKLVSEMSAWLIGVMTKFFCFSCKPPLLKLLKYYYCTYVQMPVCVGYNERTVFFFFFFFFFFTPTQTSGSNKGEKLLAWPVALAFILLQKQWLHSQHGLLLGQTHKIHTHPACTLALLLMLMPRSILLSSCKPRHGRAAPFHFNTLTEPRLKLLI